jgi:hypothetical protein
MGFGPVPLSKSRGTLYQLPSTKGVLHQRQTPSTLGAIDICRRRAQLSNDWSTLPTKQTTSMTRLGRTLPQKHVTIPNLTSQKWEPVGRFMMFVGLGDKPLLATPQPRRKATRIWLLTILRQHPGTIKAKVLLGEYCPSPPWHGSVADLWDWPLNIIDSPLAIRAQQSLISSALS